MLSAAEDIMSAQKTPTNDVNETCPSQDTCQKTLTSRGCFSTPTGAVLVADNLPALLVQLTFPFFMHRIPFGIRHIAVCLLQIANYLVVAFSQNVAMSLAGITLAGFGQGIGEITYLAMSSYFPPYTVAAWSSGTGGAGLVGSFAYAFLTQPNMGGLPPKTALLIMLFIPVLFAIAYWIILDMPDEVYSPKIHPKTWIVPVGWEETNRNTENTDIDSIKSGSTKKSISSEDGNSNVTNKVPQKELSFMEKLKHIVPLLHLMIPLSLVYWAEYMINQGLTSLIIFKCSQGWNLSTNSQYRWYQVLYQLGVFISRSSVKIIELPTLVIYFLPVLQTANLIFFLFEAIYWFVPNIGIIFALIVFEGLLGGSAYVNTYNKIHKRVSPEVREFSLSITSLGNSIGTNAAGFLAIPLYQFVFNQPIHHS